jgi:hypothetical protein
MAHKLFTLYWKTIMKRLYVLFVLILLLMAMVQGQQKLGIEVSVSSGYVIPSTPMTFANYWKMQYGGGVGVGFALTPSITLLGSVEYYRFQLDVDGINNGFDAKFMREICQPAVGSTLCRLQSAQPVPSYRRWCYECFPQRDSAPYNEHPCP